MRKRVIFVWSVYISLIISIFCLLFRKIFSSFYQNEIVWDIINFMIFANLIYFLLSFIFTIPFIGAPKVESKPHLLPENVDISAINNNGIICRETKKGIFTCFIGRKKIVLNMRGWLFKKHKIRDIILLYKHLDYYHKHKLKSAKLLHKSYFKNEKDCFITFVDKNDNKSILYIIKNGKEKRTMLLSIKLFLIITIVSRRERWKKDHHKEYSIEMFYIYL